MTDQRTRPSSSPPLEPARQRLAPPNTVGGGMKKVLYTLGTLRKLGFRKWTKALKSNNACKACGLGMGGQRGGMVNELDEYPAVCNKSIQAQSTDIQPPIPSELFAKHPLKDFKELSAKEIEHLGRLATPIYKAADQSAYVPVSWEHAFERIAEAMQKTLPARSFFYSSGRSSNEAGFVLQLLARIYGTNNVNNCSYYCHQATGVALANTIGTGTSTVELHDLTGCDLVFLIGANPASNHPRLIHKLKDLRDRGGNIVVINPAKEPGLVRFAVPKSPKSLLLGGTEIASEYLQPNIGTDITLLTGIAKAVLQRQAVDLEFIAQHTNGYADFASQLETTDWQTIVDSTGVSRAQIEQVAELYCSAKKVVFAWGMGMTHHQHGVANIEYISNLALLRGMVGKPYAGLLPLRGHSNVQGIGTIGVKPVLPEDIFAQIERHFSISLPRQPGLDTLACLDAAYNQAMDFALMMGGNLYGASPDHQWAEAALDQIGFKVFLTTTLNHGHVHGMDSSAALVLPVTARDEEWQATSQESMFNFVRLSDGGINRLDNVRPEVVVLTEIAERVLPTGSLDFSAFRQHRHTRAAIAACIPGMEQLQDIDQAGQEFHIPGRLMHQPAFKTKDQRANFVCHDFSFNGGSEAYPYTMMSVRSEGQFNTIIYEEEDSYRGTDDRWCVLMSPVTMEKLGINRATRVTLRSPFGEMKGLKVFPLDLPEANVMTYFPEANRLIGRDQDHRSHTPAFKSVPVHVEVETQQHRSQDTLMSLSNDSRPGP